LGQGTVTADDVVVSVVRSRPMVVVPGREKSATSPTYGRRVRIQEANPPSVLPFGFQLPLTDFDEGGHARWIDTETLSDEVIVGSQFAQTQSDPVRPREVIKVRKLHRSRVPQSRPGSLSTWY
jgi:hypothetical protein